MMPVAAVPFVGIANFISWRTMTSKPAPRPRNSTRIALLSQNVDDASIAWRNMLYTAVQYCTPSIRNTSDADTSDDDERKDENKKQEQWLEDMD
jgi:hypothetical protein